MEKHAPWRENLHGGKKQAVSSSVHDAFRAKYFSQNALLDVILGQLYYYVYIVVYNSLVSKPVQFLYYSNFVSKPVHFLY